MCSSNSTCVCATVPDGYTGPHWIHTVVMVTVTILILLSSLFTLAVILYSAGYKSLQGIFMICIAVANLLVGVIVTPVGIFLAYHPEKKALVCNICPLSSVVLLWSITFVLYCIGFMALEKFLKIKLSINYVTRIRPAYGWVVASVTAIGSGIVASYPVISGNAKGYYTFTSFVCAYQYYQLLYASTPAILLNVGTHVALGLLVRNIKQNLSSMCPSMPRRLNRDLTAAKTISISLGIFMCSYVPATVCMFIRNEQDVPNQVFFSVSWLAISNNFFISILYYHHNSVFRNKTRKLLQSMLSPCQSTLSKKAVFVGLWTFSEGNEHLSL